MLVSFFNTFCAALLLDRLLDSNTPRLNSRWVSNSTISWQGSKSDIYSVSIFRSTSRYSQCEGDGAEGTREGFSNPSAVSPSQSSFLVHRATFSLPSPFSQICTNPCLVGKPCLISSEVGGYARYLLLLNPYPPRHRDGPEHSSPHGVPASRGQGGK